jgi:hypothetical protein
MIEKQGNRDSPSLMNRPQPTVVWSPAMEAEDFLKVPRTLLRLGRYDRTLAGKMQPRHILLALALASRKFRDLPIRAKWTDLAYDLGTRPDTVRKWAYEMKQAGLLHIERPKSSVDRGDRRNKFYLDKLVHALETAHDRRSEERTRVREGKN